MQGLGFVLESATWRASPDWGARLGYGTTALSALNHAAIDLLVDVRSGTDGDGRPVVVSGCIGPRGDGYDAGTGMSADDARAYHSVQVATFAETEADMVHAMTITSPDEAIGIVQAAQDAAMPCAISFTLETDGALPDGTPLAAAIQRVDDATGGAAAYFGLNCAHPSHFAQVLEPGADWMSRLRGVRANASRKSHAELDEATELDAGDPVALAEHYVELRAAHPQLTVLGGCCGTDLRHVQAMAAALVPAPAGPG